MHTRTLGQGLEVSAIGFGSVLGGPPGVVPAASAGARYFRSVLRSTPRLSAISFFDRPACQHQDLGHIDHVERSPCHRPSVLVPDGRKAAPSRWPGPPRHARHPHGELRERRHESRLGPDGVARRRCALEAVQKLVTASEDTRHQKTPEGIRGHPCTPVHTPADPGSAGEGGRGSPDKAETCQPQDGCGSG